MFLMVNSYMQNDSDIDGESHVWKMKVLMKVNYGVNVCIIESYVHAS